MCSGTVCSQVWRNGNTIVADKCGPCEGCHGAKRTEDHWQAQGGHSEEGRLLMNSLLLVVGNVLSFIKYFVLILEEVTAQVSENSSPTLTSCCAG